MNSTFSCYINTHTKGDPRTSEHLRNKIRHEIIKYYTGLSVINHRTALPWGQKKEVSFNHYSQRTQRLIFPLQHNSREFSEMIYI